MSRTTIILVSILAVVAIGGGAYLWMHKSTLLNANTGTTQNSNTTVTTNTPTAGSNLNLSIPDTLKGDKTLDNDVTVAGATLHVSSSLMTATYESVAAPKDKEFLIVYFDPISGDKVSAVDLALEADAHLVQGKTTIALSGVKVATTLVQNDRGYLKFIVPAGAKGLVLEIGTGASAQHVPLAY